MANKNKEEYIYLVKRVLDGKLFVTYGNFKNAAYRPTYMWELFPENWNYKVKTPWGEACNIPYDGARYNSKEFHVIRQEKIKDV